MFRTKKKNVVVPHVNPKEQRKSDSDQLGSSEVLSPL
jgi:hypothetical protein